MKYLVEVPNCNDPSFINPLLYKILLFMSVEIMWEFVNAVYPLKIAVPV